MIAAATLTPWNWIVSFFSTIKAPDVIAIFNTGVAAWAAWIARAASRAATNAIDTQKALQVEQRRTSYFQAVVVNPCLDAITEFRGDAARALKVCAAEMTALGATAPLQQYKDTSEKAITKFNALYGELENAVLVAVRSWGEQELLDNIVTILTALQDEVTAGISHQVGGTPDDGPLKEVLQLRLADAISLIVSYDRDRSSIAVALKT